MPHSLLEVGRGLDRGDGDEAHGNARREGAERRGDVAPVLGERGPEADGDEPERGGRNGRAPERDEGEEEEGDDARSGRAARTGRPVPCVATNETKTAVARAPLTARFQRPPTRQTIGSVMFTAAKATNARKTPRRGRLRVTTSS